MSEMLVSLYCGRIQQHSTAFNIVALLTLIPTLPSILMCSHRNYSTHPARWLPWMYGLKKGQVGLAKLRLGANSQKPSPPDLIGGFGGVHSNFSCNVPKNIKTILDSYHSYRADMTRLIEHVCPAANRSQSSIHICA
jgi:hypothetical protein